MNWSDVAKVVIGGILTLSGGVLAVWVSSRLSGRQALWTQKRDVYGRLLETLGEDSHTLTMLSNVETWPPSHALSEEMRAYQKSEIEQLQKRHNDLTRELYRVSSLARLFVSEAAVEALHGISIPSYVSTVRAFNSAPAGSALCGLATGKRCKLADFPRCD